MTPRRFFEISEKLGFRRRVVATILGLQLVSTIFESIGLAILLPVFQFIQKGRDIAALTADSRLWQLLVDSYAYVGLEVNLVTLLATSFLCILARQTFVYLRLVYMARARENLVRDIRTASFENYLFADTAYQDRQPVGEIVNDLTTELQRAVAALFSAVTLVGYGILTAVYVGVLMALSPMMTLAAFGVILASGFAIRRLLAETENTGRKVTEANQQMSSFLVQRLGSVRLVRLSGTENAESSAMAKLIARQRDHLVRLATLLARIEVVIEPLVVGVGFVLLYVGVVAFDLAIEQIGFFLVVVLRLLPVVKEAMRVRQGLLGATGGLEAVVDRLDSMKAAREKSSGTLPFTGPKRELRLEGVHFDYRTDSETPALAGIDLSIPAGKMTALVGPSGGGKSTLVDMLPRLREPDRGRILVDGIALTDFSLSSLRNGIAYAPQSPQIFNVSAAMHIRYGRPEADMAEIRAAAELAGAADFIEALPDGYDTLLGENGDRLSGGQRQRLDLARALVKRAPILILDEPTSNLDAEAEALFRAALERIRSETGTTIIIIGHRLSTVAGADKIAVLDRGRVVESGRHAELLSLDGWYARAWATQTEGAGPEHADESTVASMA